MKTISFLTTLAAALTLTSTLAAQQADAEGWISLFNGKDLTGWTPKIKGHDLGDNFGETFRVEDGVIKVRYDKYQEFGGKFGHLLENPVLDEKDANAKKLIKDGDRVLKSGTISLQSESHPVEFRNIKIKPLKP